MSATVDEKMKRKKGTKKKWPFASFAFLFFALNTVSLTLAVRGISSSFFFTEGKGEGLTKKKRKTEK